MKYLTVMTDSTREGTECYDKALLLRNYSTFYCHKQQTEIILQYSYFPMVHLNKTHYPYSETRLQNLINTNDDNFFPINVRCPAESPPDLAVYYVHRSAVCSKIYKSQLWLTMPCFNYTGFYMNIQHKSLLCNERQSATTYLYSFQKNVT